MRHVLTSQVLAAGALIMVIGASVAAFGIAPSVRAQTPATIKVVAPAEELDKSAAEVSVDVVATDVTNLAGFQFVLSYDEDVLTYSDVKKGDFLASTSREAVCNDPIVQTGSLRLSCVTLRETPLGPDGTGTLATIHFKPKASGTSTLTLSAAKVVHPDGSPIESTTVDSQVVIKGGSDSNTTMIVVIVAVVAALAIVLAGGFAVMRRRSASGPTS